jgi:hypothetical protein
MISKMAGNSPKMPINAQQFKLAAGKNDTSRRIVQ